MRVKERLSLFGGEYPKLLFNSGTKGGGKSKFPKAI